VLLFIAALVVALGLTALAAPPAYAAYVSEGTIFEESIAHQGSGAADTVLCRFQATGPGVVRVAGGLAGSGVTAVPRATTGTLTIPAQISHDGESYRVTEIGSYAFGDYNYPATSCALLEAVVLPATLETIGTNAFANTTALATLSLPASLKSIGSYAFYNCRALKTLTLPASVTSLGDYAFCRASGLTTVIFNGNAATGGVYLFTGPGMRIARVIYRGTAYPNPTEIFNSEEVAQPDFFYTVRFFASLEAVSNSAPLATAVVSGRASYLELRSGLAASYIYEGSLPALPTATNLWLFEGDPNLGSNLAASCYAYAAWRDYQNLSVNGKIQLTSKSYTGGPLAPEPQALDALGTRLVEGVQVSYRYYRQDPTAPANWIETTDFTSLGSIRVVATALAGSIYTGSVTGLYAISLGSTSFVQPVALTLPDGTQSTVPCGFRVLTRSGATANVEVARSPFPEAGLGGASRAVPAATNGFLHIPETFRVGNYTLTVIRISDSAFGYAGPLDEGACNRLTGIEFPTTLATVGTNAFRLCGGLKTVIFKGNASTVSFGQMSFETTPQLGTIVYYGKKEKVIGLFASGPQRYYTISFYSRKADVSAGTPLGTATIRESVPLAYLPDLVGTAPGGSTAGSYTGPLWSGAVPAYPSWIQDDGVYFAPYWKYPEVNEDDLLALRSTLSDSVYAYGEQTNDAYSLEDALVFGLEVGQEFVHTGLTVFETTGLTVCGPTGGVLKLGVDYTLQIQRQALDGSWAATTDVVELGSLRVEVKGIGAYRGSFHVPFSIIALAEKDGSLVTAKVTLISPEGLESLVDCRFRVLQDSEGVLSVEVHSPGNVSTKAVATNLAGRLIIPERIRYSGLYYPVTGISAYALGSTTASSACARITEVAIPSTVRSIGMYAFANMAALGAMELPGAARELGIGIFQGSSVTSVRFGEGISSVPSDALRNCSRLASVSLPSTVTAIGSYTFSDCSQLASISLPAKLTTIGTSAFANCNALRRVVLPGTLTNFTGAFYPNSGITEVVLEEGITEVSTNAFRGTSALRTLSLPSTLRSFASYAFYQSRIDSVTLPPQVTNLGTYAFASCLNLKTVVFKGDASHLTVSSPFYNSPVTTVVFEDRAYASWQQVFAAGTKVYFRLNFYENTDALRRGTAIGTALVREGTLLDSLRSENAGTLDLYAGTIPALPDLATRWNFAADAATALGADPSGGRASGIAHHLPLSDSLVAFAEEADLTDLSYGKLLISELGYGFTGSAIDPVARGETLVVDAEGVPLDPAEYTISYERMGLTASDWTPTFDLTTVGTLRIVATATAESSYYGSVRGVYSITRHLVGMTFVQDDAYGHPVTYYVRSLATGTSPGTVWVGIGNYGSPAVPTGTSGTLALPNIAYDPDGLPYEPVSIAPYAFYRIMGIRSIIIPRSITSIGNGAFQYGYAYGDVETSQLTNIVFKNNLDYTSFGVSVFYGCESLQTIVYEDKKGSFNDFGANTAELKRYYAAEFYASDEDWYDGNLAARLILREGAYTESPSPNEFFPGIEGYPASSTTLPTLPADHRWRYEAGTLGAGRTIMNSLYAYARPMDSGAIVADVLVRNGALESYVPCTFDYVYDDAEEPTGEAQVGIGLAPGQTAIDPSVVGTVVIPAEVEDADGSMLPVTRIAPFAFGGESTAEACALTGIELPAGIRSIGQAAFANCEGLSLVSLDDASRLASIETMAFSNNRALHSVVLPDTLTTLGPAAFERAGLRAIEIPWQVEELGRGAFDQCTELREVVFGGLMSLDLAPLGGEPFAVAKRTVPATPLSAATRLAGLDDYVFANCTSLERVVFDADIAGLTVSEVAFEGSPAVSTVVFGGLKTDIAFSDAEPARYMTLSYFEDTAARDRLERTGYLCVREGSSPFSGPAYAGQIPTPAEHFEWIYEQQAISTGVWDSCYALMDRARYELDTSEVDAAFRVSFTTGGEKITRAQMGDTVEVWVLSLGATRAAGIQVIDATTQEVCAEVSIPTDVPADSASPQMSFTMPGGDVSLRVLPALELQLYKQALYAQPQHIRSFTLDQMRALATSPLQSFSAYNSVGQPLVVTAEAGAAVPLAALLAEAGLEFGPGDYLVLEYAIAGDAPARRTASYNMLYSSERFYYPNLVYNDEYGGERREPHLALATETHRALVDGSAPDVLDAPSMLDAYQLLFGQSFEDLMESRDTAGSFTADITSITVVNGVELLEACTVAGIEESYLFTGEELKPRPTLTDSNGRVLVEGLDYELSWTDNYDAGTGRVVAEGIGNYGGVREVSFRILRARDLSGDGRDATAARIALEAYPRGSAGAILASGANFPDALSATGLAGVLDYPVVLTTGEGLSADARAALEFLAADASVFELLIIGGTSAVSESAESEATSLLASARVAVYRLAGADRFATSQEVFYHGQMAGGWKGTVIVATGMGFADALSISPYAAFAPAPILLCDGQSLSAGMKADIASADFTRALVIGGTGAVSDTVSGELEGMLGSGRVTRLGGQDRFQTSLLIAEWEIAEAGMGVDGAGITTGLNFPDGLAGGALLGQTGSVLLLTSPDDTTTLGLLPAHRGRVNLLRFFGGESVVSRELRVMAVDGLGWAREVLDR
jgi:hypothetical protein